MWFLRADWDFCSKFDPGSTLESVPHVVYVLEYVTIVMPVSLPPGPSSMCEALFGWSPVVPFTIVESIPDLFGR